MFYEILTILKTVCKVFKAHILDAFDGNEQIIARSYDLTVLRFSDLPPAILRQILVYVRGENIIQANKPR